MSNAFSLASVTAVLRGLIRDALADGAVSSIISRDPAEAVTALAPDLIALGRTGDVGVNVYLYATTPNVGWRNAGLPTRNAAGVRLANPPLALDLHYLITAYGVQELHAEVLLGHAMQRLHQVPVLDRGAIRSTLALLPSPLDRLADSGLADQVEQIRLTPSSLSAEEVSKLWSAFQASYRLSAAYVASVLLVEAEEPARSAIPVLTRGTPDPVTREERGVAVTTGVVPPVPTLDEVRPPRSQPVARLGDSVRLLGHHLDGTGHRVQVSHSRFTDVSHEIAPDSAEAGRVVFTIPTVPAGWPVGHYILQVQMTRDGVERTTNTLPLTLAPRITNAPLAATIAPGPNPTATIVATVEPEVRPDQSASLVVGKREVLADPFASATGSLSFQLVIASAGTLLSRLRVDGIESVYIDREASPPVFEPSQVVQLS
ncbi:MAG: DUF4255 domain-containing protein [Bacteroidota bacterium]